MPGRLTTGQVMAAFRAAAGDAVPLPQAGLSMITAHTVDALVGHTLRAALLRSARLFANRIPEGATFDHCEHAVKQGESMLDVTVYIGRDDPYRLVASAESEAYGGHGIDELGSPSSGSENNGYLWDLWKLLQIPSPLRLFVARITRNRHDGEDRCLLLRRRIERMVQDYRPCYSPNDRIFSIVLPARGSYKDVVWCDGWHISSDGHVESLASATWA